MLCKGPSSAVAAVWTARADVAVVPQFGGSAPDDRVQFRGNETRPDRPYDLRQFLPLSQDGNRLDYRDARSRDWMAAELTLFVLRAALTNAVAKELLPRNVAAIVRLPNPRKPQRQWWSVEEARAFLESARRDHDPLYAAYVLILVLGLRRGEALGLTWTDVHFDAAEVHIRWQLQRAGPSDPAP